MNRPGADVSNAADRSGNAAICRRVSTEDQGKGDSITAGSMAALSHTARAWSTESIWHEALAGLGQMPSHPQTHPME
jgi:hypothetical protein